MGQREAAAEAGGSGAAVREAPRSGPVELVRSIWELRSDPLTPAVRAIEDGAEDIVQARVPGMRLVRLHRVRHVEHVLVKNQDNYPKGSETELLRRVLGQGLVTSRGELWRRQRRLIQPMFAKRHLEPFAAHMTAAGGRMLADWDSTHRDGDRVDVADARRALSERTYVEEQNRRLIEEMQLEPERHRWVRVANEDIGEPGCKHWHVRPRWGVLGMLLNWWRVVVSSGCPLAA